MGIRVGYIPEHFSTPLFFAKQQGYYAKHGVEIEFLPYPSGSGHLIQSLEDGTIDVSIGLTEAHIRAIAAGSKAYKLAGIYVQSPLCWAISTGASRDISMDTLEGKTIGISRVGSGSDVMAKVLQHQQKWLPFEYAVLDTFANLRDGVNHKNGKACDAFMWEHFTSKRYYDNGEIKKIGEIYTPWPSWVISVSPRVTKQDLDGFLAAINEGVVYFNEHPEEAIEYIASNLDYSAEDAQSWLKTVKFSSDVSKIDPAVVEKTLSVLRLAVELPKDCDKLDYLV